MHVSLFIFGLLLTQPVTAIQHASLFYVLSVKTSCKFCVAAACARN